MARKMNIPKAKQILGLRKAIANRKTPKQFLPSLKKRLAKLTVFILFALIASSAYAQTPVTIQPMQQTLASATLANNTCTGSAQTFPVNNRNQTQHVASIAASGTVTSLQMVIQGVDNSGNVFNLSDIGQVNGSVFGSGYFPTVQVQVTCLPNTATFTLSYSASGSGTPVNAGSFFVSQVDKLLFQNVSATVNQTTGILATPFGSSSGLLVFRNTNTAGVGTLQVACSTVFDGAAFTGNFFFNIANTIVLQKFYVPATQCPQMKVTYTIGGSPSGTMNLEYVFDPPGLQPSSTQANNCVQPNGTGLVSNLPTVAISVGANSTQQLVAPSGITRIVVCGFVVSVGVAGTVQLTEGTGATCGTGPSNVSGAINLAVGTPLSTGSSLPFFITNVAGDGLCLTTAGGATAAGLLSYEYMPI
jgi:hypothetical protein